jgi:VIT1/CCC1 family predicted Fe2+/Mn2+ transporter
LQVPAMRCMYRGRRKLQRSFRKLRRTRGEAAVTSLRSKKTAFFLVLVGYLSAALFYRWPFGGVSDRVWALLCPVCGCILFAPWVTQTSRLIRYTLFFGTLNAAVFLILGMAAMGVIKFLVPPRQSQDPQNKGSVGN